jgi:uncharacterized membrane protein
MKRYLITGLIIWAPLAITIWVLQFFVGVLDQSLNLFPEQYHPRQLFGFYLPGVGAILTVAVLLLTGWVVTHVLGERLIAWWNAFLNRIPVLGAIYKAVKQVSDTLLAPNGNAFRKVLLVRYPHPEAWSLAFQTSIPGEISRRLDDDYVAVFIPTTPSPVNGFYFYVRRADTIELDMAVDVALRTIVSMGVVAAPEAGRPPASDPTPA